MSKEQGAGFYRFKVGEFEVAPVSDGLLQFENPKHGEMRTSLSKIRADGRVFRNSSSRATT